MRFIAVAVMFAVAVLVGSSDQCSVPHSRLVEAHASAAFLQRPRVHFAPAQVRMRSPPRRKTFSLIIWIVIIYRRLDDDEGADVCDDDAACDLASSLLIH